MKMRSFSKNVKFAQTERTAASIFRCNIKKTLGIQIIIICFNKILNHGYWGLAVLIQIDTPR